MGDKYTLPEPVVKQLNLERLTQLHLSQGSIKKDESKYTFLGIGEITTHYEAEVVKVDAYASRLAGADSPYRAKRGAYHSTHLQGTVPNEATHYCLGPRTSQNEAYRNKNEAFSYDIVPIVFLRVEE